MSLSAGQKFGHYEILKPLGRGGMGEVYLAFDQRLKRQVAIKILSSALIERPDQLQRFRQEALFAAVLNHPNICTIYEAGEVNGTTFIAMEYVEGETLRHYVVSRKITLSEILDYSIQIADGLKEAHHKNVIHRDIKTSNIILTPRKTVKILDFGLAKQIAHLNQEIFSEASTDFSSGVGAMPRGTTPYMSPEGLLGKKVDQRSDLFSFGVVLYEMLTGQLPFRGTTNIEVIDAILHNDPLTGTHYRSNVPEPLVRVLRKLLEKDPEERYQSAHELWIDLRKIREEITRADSIPPTQVQVKQKAFSWNWAALVITLSIFLGVSAYYYLAKKNPRAATIIQHVNELVTVAVLPFNYSGDNEHKYFGTLVTDALIAGMESEPGLSVASYETVKDIDKAESIQKTAKNLGVQCIIRGEISSQNSKVLIHPEMISHDGTRIWSKEIDGSVDGIISTLTEMKNAMVSELTESPHGKGIAQVRTSNPEAYKFYIEARSYYDKWDQEENLSKAITLFKKSLNIDGNSGAAHAGLAMALLTEYLRTLTPSLLVEATSEVQKGIQLDPGLPEVLIAKGLVELQRGNSVEAKNAFAKTLELSPGNDAACIHIARVYETSGRFIDAKEMYQQAIALRPSYWWNHYNLGTFLYLTMADFENARPPLLKATELYPDGSAPLIVLGYLDLYSGKIDVAEGSFRKVLQKTPSDIIARNGLGVVYFYQRKYELGVQAFTRLVKESPDQVIYQINLADALRASGNMSEGNQHYTTAIKTFRSLLQSNPNDDPNRAGLAMALSATGQCKEAKEQIRSVYERQKQNIELTGYTLITASRCNDLEWAIPIALEAISKSNLIDVLYHPDLEPLRQQPAIQKALSTKKAIASKS
jgi:serine/threonine-protein kinase